MTQTSSRIFDEMARLMNDAAGVASGVRREFDTLFKSQAERILRDLDVVKREEFEAAKDMARIAREENEALKARVAALEAKLGFRPQPVSTWVGAVFLPRRHRRAFLFSAMACRLSQISLGFQRESPAPTHVNIHDRGKPRWPAAVAGGGWTARQPATKCSPCRHRHARLAALRAPFHTASRLVASPSRSPATSRWANGHATSRADER